MEKDTLIKLIDSGFSQRGLARELNTSHGNIRYWLHKFNLKTSHVTKEGVPYNCRHCNTTDPSKFNGRCKTICTKCSNRISRLRKKLKCVIYKGGKCESCGYNKYLEVLEFHHKDPDEKDFSISASSKRGTEQRSWEVLKKELDKCLMLCANCHREIHAKEKDYEVYYKVLEKELDGM